MLVVLFSLAILHSSLARFGDDDYWRAQRKIDCNRKCPRRERICDGKPDCKDGSDEEDCTNCQGSAFHCANDRCVPMFLRCDKHDDCWDGSDEQDCSDFVRPSGFEVPATIERIDAKRTVMRNYSDDISALSDFTLNIVAYKTVRPEQGLDARTLYYKRMGKVVFYVHGFRTDDLIDGINMKDALAQGTDDVDCVLVIDWRKGSYLLDPDAWWSQHWPPALVNEYKNVVFDNVPVVANVVSWFINQYIPDNVKIHLIGFSLGGQIAGMAARTLKNHGLRMIERISALDPAGPIYEYSLTAFPTDTTNTLRPSDAAFVDVIHASSVLGMEKDAGHLDIDIEDADCILPPCLHHKAIDVYIASINNCSQIACPSGKLGDGFCQVVHPGELASLGYSADLYNGRGRHTVRYFYYVILDKAHKISTKNCNTFLPVFLSAKDRVCRSPPAVGSDCRRRPYLTECEQTCDDVKNKLVCSVGGITLHTGNGLQPPLQQQREQVTSAVTWSGEKCEQPLSCYGEDGESLDYFIAYKEPNSLRYFYFSRTADGLSVRMTPGRYSIADSHSVLGRTLLPIYEQVSPITYIVYNDDIPYGSKGSLVLNMNSSDDIHTQDSASFGHAKGVLAYSKTGGFFLSHSVPRFPPDPDSYSYKYPDSGMKYAQMAVCVTSKTSPFYFVDEMAMLLTMMADFRPQLYASNVNDFWRADVRNKFEILIRPPSKGNLGPPIKREISYGNFGVRVHSFSRSQKELYEDCFQTLASRYGTPLLAQTWLDRSNSLPSSCRNVMTVENVEEVRVFYEATWAQTNDHSKWMVTKMGGAAAVICVGDLNRAKSTIARGGLFVCIGEWTLLNLFNANVRISKYQECPPL